MSKLIIEDDNGLQTELKIGVIRETSLSPGDVLVATYNFQNTTKPSDINRVLENLREMFLSILPKGVEVVTYASLDGKKNIELEILKKES